ncbi:MAG: DUF116 domain-containing protein [Firmicutes bacterium]|nr:DUF116 domain-containing protein [Bacillota bacterium]
MPVKKRLFIGLSIASIIFIFGLGALVLYLISHQENLVNRVSLYVLGGLLGLLVLVVIFGVAGIVLTIWSARGIPPLQGFIRITNNLLFPVALNLGKWMGYGPEVIRGSFIEVNNQMVRTKKITVPADKILVLTPHCLQRVECPHKITIDVENCKECGLCPVKGLIELCRHYRVKLAVATGGTFARRFVETHRPWAIVAVACELDLSSGIQDTNPLPVMGVLNRRPQGPCRNTEIDLDKVEAAICFFLGRADTDRVAERIEAPSPQVIRLEVVSRKSPGDNGTQVTPA